MREDRTDKNKNRMAKYTMGVTVRLTRIEAHRIRRFEQAEIIRPARTEARQRLYSDYEIELIKEIAELEDQGINLVGIKVILAMRRGGKI